MEQKSPYLPLPMSLEPILVFWNLLTWASFTFFFLGGIFWFIYILFKIFFRYQLFLQLKRDLDRGRLLCTLEDALLFSAYIVQGEIIKLWGIFIANNVPYENIEDIKWQ